MPREYEIAEDDPRPIADPELEFEADKSGKVHTRKNPGNTEFLPGYGTTNFGISAYESKRSLPIDSIILGAGLAAGGFLAWTFREKVYSGAETLINYGLLLKEASKDS